MKQVINGKTYNTDTAIYVAKKGAFFIAGIEGRGGIITRTRAEVLEWCESHDVDADVIDRFFDVEAA